MVYSVLFSVGNVFSCICPLKKNEFSINNLMGLYIYRRRTHIKKN